MKCIFSLLLFGLFIASCSNKDDGIDCSLFDPAFPELNVRITDEAGNNLIENGTIDPDSITVTGDFSGAGFRYIPAIDYVSPDAEIRAFDHTLSLYIPRESEFQYTINLKDYEAINIDFTAIFTKIPCDLSYYIPSEAFYDNEKLELQEISPLQFLVIIVL
ncbi:hypothetical protein [Zhouia amylolytica]|uniref:hypothetical protein n=1 Tax=Zhouia amylolytica TaxID=376730 RepID=UPI0020CC1362|nr:hypothetical protein [Zhouia amylolytica]MCQ0112549.1 hypothetical protein [Zhouia amylolytica]